MKYCALLYDIHILCSIIWPYILDNCGRRRVVELTRVFHGVEFSALAYLDTRNVYSWVRQCAAIEL